MAQKIQSIILAGNSNNIQAQNKIATALGAEQTLFLYQGKGSELEVERDGYYYAYIAGDAGDTILMNPVTDVNASDSEEKASKEFDGLKKNCLIDLGSLKEGELWKFTSEEEEETEVQAWVYRLNIPSLEEVMAKLGENPFYVSSYGDGYMDGKITMSEAGNLILTVPSDIGWIVTVDGEEITAEKWMNAFISIPLEAGEHEISLRYEVQGLGAGIGISLLSIVIFVVLVIVRKKNA